MRCGITLHIQSYQDWDEYEAAERGASVPPLNPQFDAKRFTDELGSALKLENLRADSMSTVEHHSSLYVGDKPHPVVEFVLVRVKASTNLQRVGKRDERS